MNRLDRYISSQFKNPRGIFGSIISLIQNNQNAAMYQKAVSLLDVQPEEKVLDIGYGNGHLLELIYKKCAADLYGIDISSDAKVMATKRNRKANQFGKLHLQVGDCCNLNYEADTFAGVTSINTIYFWPDTVKGLSEIRRVLQTGCSFYNIVYTREFLDTIKYTQIGYKKFETEQLVQYGADAGFSNVAIKDIKKGTSMAIIYTK